MNEDKWNSLLEGSAGSGFQDISEITPPKKERKGFHYPSNISDI